MFLVVSSDVLKVIKYIGRLCSEQHSIPNQAGTWSEMFVTQFL